MLFHEYLNNKIIAFQGHGRHDAKAKKILGNEKWEMGESDYKRLGLKVAKELSDLIIYCISVPFKEKTKEEVAAFASKAGGRCETMSSLNESKAKDYMVNMEKGRQAFQKYHQKQISRVYPKVIKEVRNIFTTCRYIVCEDLYMLLNFTYLKCCVSGNPY